MHKAVSPSRILFWFRSICAPGSASLLLLLILTLTAVVVDQLAAPVLHSSSPLWAVTACLLLVWRRGPVIAQTDFTQSKFNSLLRLFSFLAAHLVLIFLARVFQNSLQFAAGTPTAAGWLVAGLKLSVLLPALILLPIAQWRLLLRSYSAELVAALVVLFTYFPVRAMEGAWPWYGQVLGRTVYYLAKVFVPSLTYVKSLTPTVSGPDLDVTILFRCSGINGIELFDYLFAFVVFLDWNRLRKGQTLLAYFGGVFAILLGNALRITSLTVLGNRGYADVVAHFHISAGWIFFSAIFLAYLSLTYQRLLIRPPDAPARG